AVAIVARPDALLEVPGLLRERHGPQLDVRNTGAGSRPHSATIIRRELLDPIVRQVALAGKILAAVPLGRRKIQPHQTLRRPEPESAVRGAGRGGDVADGRWDGVGSERAGNGGVGRSVERADLLRVSRELDRLDCP